jgi:calcium permeable stress-gated cation channel
MKPGKQRLGRLYSAAATVFLCFFWSVPTAFIASLTEVNSLKEQSPGLNDLVEQYPWLENVLFQLAPMLLLVLNEVFLPMFLKFFATWEGFISSAMLEASLFIKLGVFMVGTWRQLGFCG